MQFPQCGIINIFLLLHLLLVLLLLVSLFVSLSLCTPSCPMTAEVTASAVWRAPWDCKWIEGGSRRGGACVCACFGNTGNGPEWMRMNDESQYQHPPRINTRWWRAAVIFWVFLLWNIPCVVSLHRVNEPELSEGHLNAARVHVLRNQGGMSSYCSTHTHTHKAVCIAPKCFKKTEWRFCLTFKICRPDFFATVSAELPRSLFIYLYFTLTIYHPDIPPLFSKG